MQIRPFSLEDTDVVIELWTSAGLVRPWNDPRKDIERKLTVQPELFLVGEADGVVIAAAMVGYDGHRGWVNYLAVSPGSRGLEYGRRMMEEAERLLVELGCPKLNLQIRSDNAEVRAFYEHLGYTEDAAVSYGKRLIAD
ncbi:GNAT family acetyltransferase [Agreia sp. VKM Ac-1783]|jgi:ribosomal protein S18 acetylase RimI-like enzyme|uniref:GNAT family acetyltransferase n=1 Tax=Agreia sp. VKM Ac-1783 TaxID=1938889 RepID=UPI000A2AE110|nr:GNAT family acetyltransferase [Agreia sp. VKM Ac-1783]SMQ59767.1 Ribosomal protein S18 acetylase RimI [Agreia sp. VKM Ac-1783]